jgi:hypothetical protein
VLLRIGGVHWEVWRTGYRLEVLMRCWNCHDVVELLSLLGYPFGVGKVHLG